MNWQSSRPWKVRYIYVLYEGTWSILTPVLFHLYKAHFHEMLWITKSLCSSIVSTKHVYILAWRARKRIVFLFLSSLNSVFSLEQTIQWETESWQVCWRATELAPFSEVCVCTRTQGLNFSDRTFSLFTSLDISSLQCAQLEINFLVRLLDI